MKRLTNFVPSKLIFDWVRSQLMIDNKTLATMVHKTIFTLNRQHKD
jgi:hypothetical protein